MKMMLPFEFNEIFPNKPVHEPVESIKTCLQSLCRLETLRYCIHLNLFVSNLSTPLETLAQQQVLLRMFFNNHSIERLNKIAASTQDPINRLFFHRMQILELIRYVTSYCADSNCHRTPIQNKKSKNQFFQATLLASEIAMKKLEAGQQEIESTRDKRELLLRLVRLSAQSALQISDPARAFGRGSLMFTDYLPKEFPEFHKQFEGYTKLTIKEYFSCIFIAFVHYYNVPLEQGSHTRHLITPKLYEQIPHMAKSFARYLEIASQKIDELQASLWNQGENTKQYSLKPIRERPILRLDNNNAIVIDPVLHLDQAMISPLFMLSGVLAKQGINLQGHFGDAFEKYAQNILEKMCDTESIERLLLIGNEVEAQGNQICDACIIEGDALLLFEMKAAWVRDDRVADQDYTKYVAQLREKYGKKGNAAFQLARAANRLIDGKWRLKNHDMKRTKRIYPVLIAYDSLLNLPGHFWFFASEFRSEFKPDAILKGSKTVMRKNGWEIAPLTIMTIDVLEDLEKSVNNFKLSDLLKDYFDYCDANFRDVDDDLSLSEFINRKYSSKMDRHGNVLQKALDTFDEIKNVIIPVSPTLNMETSR